MFDVPLGQLSGSTFDAPSSHLMEALKSSQADVLVVESECDAVMPHAVIERYLAAMPQARHAVIAGARHELSDPAWAAAFLDHILTWFADL